MRSARFLIIALAAALAGCGDSNGTGPEATVTTVTVSPPWGLLDEAGATLRFSAVAKDADGSVISGRSVTWTSSKLAVATIASDGVATSVAPGTATLTAAVEGVTGSATLTVFGAAQNCDNAQTVLLAVGEAQTFSASDCILLPSGASGDRYRVAVVRPATTGVASDIVATRLTVVGVGGVAQSPAAVVAPSLVAPTALAVPGLSPRAVTRALRVARATQRHHVELRTHDAALAREAGYDLLPAHPARSLPRIAAAASPEKMIFDISAGTTCAQIENSKRTGLLVTENDDIVLYQDSTERATRPISSTLGQRMTAFYSSHVRDMIPVYWGDLPDIDGNGKVVVFATPRVDDDVAAFVWSGDFYPATSCAASNQRELIYFNTDLILDMGASDPTYQALETLGHEAKHVVSLYHRIAAGRRTATDQFHPGWVEEGTAEISGEISSRLAWKAAGGPALNARIAAATFNKTITPENYGVAIHLARVVWYLSSQPNGLVVTPNGAVDEANVYGSGWTFHRWLGDAYGDAASAPMADAPLFKALTDSMAAPGATGLANQTGTPFLTLFREYVDAILLHGTSAPQPTRAFTTYDLLTATGIFQNPNPPGAFPWPVTNVGETPTASFQSATHTGPLGISGIRVHDFLSNGTGTGAQITLDAGGQPAQIRVVRLR
jgi:hypothetical protein